MDICLNMIVRNEEHCVLRALDSAYQSLGASLRCLSITDTGSTDRTKALVRDWASAHGITCDVHDITWVDSFEYARNFALEEARKLACDWILWLDADETIEGDMPALDAGADGYHVRNQTNQTYYDRVRLLNARSDWRWVGVLHEYPALDDAIVGRIDHARLRVVGHWDSARNKDPAKYYRDSVILGAEVLKNPQNARNVFYWAQSLYAAALLPQAREAYQSRVLLGGWGEELYWSKFRIANLTERIDGADAAIPLYLVAWAERPHRKEALLEAVRIYRQRQQWHAAKMLAGQAADFDVPSPRPNNDTLFVDGSCGWRAAEEFALALYKTGRTGAAQHWYRGLLRRDDIPPAARQRIESDATIVLNHEYEE